MTVDTLQALEVNELIPSLCVSLGIFISFLCFSDITMWVLVWASANKTRVRVNVSKHANRHVQANTQAWPNPAYPCGGDWVTSRESEREISSDKDWLTVYERQGNTQKGRKTEGGRISRRVRGKWAEHPSVCDKLTSSHLTSSESLLLSLIMVQEISLSPDPPGSCC